MYKNEILDIYITDYFIKMGLDYFYLGRFNLRKCTWLSFWWVIGITIVGLYKNGMWQYQTRFEGINCINWFHLFFYFLWMVPNISSRKGIHKNNMRFFMLPSPKYVANFRLRNRFSRGERWIHTGRKWAPSSAPLAEKRSGGETGGENGWIFLFFWLLYIVSTFCILRLCILHSSLMHSAFQKNASCKKYSSLMHSSLMHSAFQKNAWYKIHVHNVTCILNCVLITIQLYTIPTPVSIATDILLLYNNL